MIWSYSKELIKLKKLLIIHNKYRITGGEDIVVEQETKVLEKHFIVSSLIFSNKVSLSINKLPLFLSSRSKESRDKLTKVIDDFDKEVTQITQIGKKEYILVNWRANKMIILKIK